jgi:hypothetical protein
LLATTSEPEVIHRGDVDPEEAAAVAETLAGYEEEFPDVSVERIFILDIRCRLWSRRLTVPTCWSSAAVVMARSPGGCSVP